MIIRTIDAHTAGEPLRLIVDGFPTIEGRTILEKRAWVAEHHDDLRTALMLEPRGHADMYGAVLTEPEHAGSDAGVLFMHNQGYSTMCGHGVIAVVTIALQEGLLVPRTDSRVVLDSPAGTIHASADVVPTAEGPRVRRVGFRNVPSFVLYAGLPVRLGGRHAARGRGVRRGLLRDRRQRGCRDPDCSRASRRFAPRGDGGQAGSRGGGEGPAPGAAAARGRLRHDLHRPRERPRTPTCAT